MDTVQSDATRATTGLSVLSEGFASSGTTPLYVGDEVTFTITLSDAVTVATAENDGPQNLPSLQLNNGKVATYAGPVGVSTSTLQFSYTARPGDTVADLQALAFNPIPIGTTIANSAGITSDPTGFSTIDTGMQVATPPVIVSAVGPALVANSGWPYSGNVPIVVFVAGEPVTFTLTVSNPVVVSDDSGGPLPSLTLNNGETAVYTGPLDTASKTLTFSYTPKSGDDITDLVATSLNVLAPGATIDDSAGTPLTTQSFSPIDAHVQISTANGPTLFFRSTATSTSPGQVTAGGSVTFMLSFFNGATVVGATPGDAPTLQLSNGAVAVYSGPVGVNTLAFTYAPQPGDVTQDLWATAINPWPAGTTIKDEDGVTGVAVNLSGFRPIDADVAVVPAVKPEQAAYRSPPVPVYGNGINAAGQVLGFPESGDLPATGATQFIVDDPSTGVVIQIGDDLDATGLNDSNQAFGITSGSADHDSGFVEDLLDGVVTEISPPGSVFVNNVSVNNHDEVTGIYSDSNIKVHLFSENLLTGDFTNRELPAADAFLSTVNDSGDAVGYSTTDQGDDGFLFNALTGNVTTIDLGPGATNVRPLAINNAGQVIGTYDDGPDNLVGFLYDSSTKTVTRIDPANDGLPVAINDSGQVIGTDVFGPFIEDTATGAVSTMIGSDGFPLEGLVAINDSGEIIGHGGAGGYIATPETACFRRGTRILTERGETPVERLQVGDIVRVASGEGRPVLWLGHRAIDVTRHPDPRSVWPVRVTAGAFGEGKPSRDLWLSPAHAVAVDGWLVQIERLINGATIARAPCDHIEYWHVELDSHDILLADGLDAESYLDTGHRASFVEAGTVVDLHAAFHPGHGAATCLPIVATGPDLAAIRARLLGRAEEMRWVWLSDPDLHIIADGVRIDPIEHDERHAVFTLPAQTRSVQLASWTWVPVEATASTEDYRTLGVCVWRVRIDDQDMVLSEPRSGWSDVETDGTYVQRWTTGLAALPSGGRRVIVDLNIGGRYLHRASRGEYTIAAA